MSYLTDCFIMCCCIDRLRTRGEIRIVGRQRSVELAMRVKTPKEAEKIKAAIKRELGRMPGCRHHPLLQAQYHHIKLKCPFEFCKKYEEFTEQDTSIDNVSLSVIETHKTKPQKATIPPSICCPICWCSLIKCMCKCCIPDIRATDVHEQDVFHHSGTEMTQVYSMPNSDMSSLLRIWLLCGMFGGHLFKAGRFKEGVCRIVLWGQMLFIVLGIIASAISYAVLAGYDAPPVDCTAQNYKNIPECGNYFVATSGRCEDVEGATPIHEEWECTDALRLLGVERQDGDLCTEWCGQDSDLMPVGCLDAEGQGGIMKHQPFRESTATCGKRDGDEYSANCICKGQSCPKNTFCPHTLCDPSECVACPTGRFSHSGATQEATCSPYFVATSGRCEDVEGAAPIREEWECTDALRLLGVARQDDDLCTEWCGQDSDLMPVGCLDAEGQGGIMKHQPFRESTATCGKRDGDEYSANCICKGQSCPKNTFCPHTLCDPSECVACPTGRFSHSGATQEATCSPYFVATSGRCEDVEGAAPIHEEWECTDALRLLGVAQHIRQDEDLCTYGCGQDSDLMPVGCLDSRGWGPTMKRQSSQESTATCGKRDGNREGDEYSANCICKGQSRRLLSDNLTRRLNLRTMQFSRNANPSTRGNATSGSDVSSSWSTAAKYYAFLREIWGRLQKDRRQKDISMMPAWFFFESGPDLTIRSAAEPNNETICHAWMRSKAEDFARTTSSSSSPPSSSFSAPYSRRRYLVLDIQTSNIMKAIIQAIRMMEQSVIGLGLTLLTLWMLDLFRLRGFLNCTHVEFSSVQSFQLMWAQPWACYLNNKKEANELLNILNKLNRSHKLVKLQPSKRPTRAQTVNKRKSRVRRLSSVRSFQLKMQGKEESKNIMKKRFSRFLTDDGDEYFVPASGDGEAVWTLPQNAVVVHY